MKLPIPKYPLNITPSPLSKNWDTPYTKNTPYFCHTIKSNCYGLVKLLGNSLLRVLLALLCWLLLLCYGKARQKVRPVLT